MSVGSGAGLVWGTGDGMRGAQIQNHSGGRPRAVLEGRPNLMTRTPPWLALV